MSKLTIASTPRVASTRIPAQARWAKQTGLGARLRNARLQAGMTPAELARDLTSTAYLSRLEAGERRPSRALLSALGDRLGIDLSEPNGTESAAATSLGFELAHADLLLASGQFEEAVWVSEDLAEISAGVGALDVSHAARVVHALALAAAGRPRAALRTVLPLTHGPAGLLAMVAQARLHLELGDPQRAIEVARRIDEQIAGDTYQLSLPEIADLTVTLCQAYVAVGRDTVATQLARRVRRQLSAAVDVSSADGAGTGAPLAISYRSFDQAVTKIETAVAERQSARLRAAIDLLGAYGPPSANRDALTYESGQAAVS